MTIFQIVIHETQTQPIFFLRIIFKVSVQTPPEVEVEPASEVSLSTYYPIMMRTNNITSSNSNTKVAISEGEGVTLACLARCYNTPTAISCRPHICHFFSTNDLFGSIFSTLKRINCGKISQNFSTFSQNFSTFSKLSPKLPKISPHDNFFPTNIICDICDKYEL